jgi:hypothetical protein
VHEESHGARVVDRGASIRPRTGAAEGRSGVGREVPVGSAAPPRTVSRMTLSRTDDSGDQETSHRTQAIRQEVSSRPRSRAAEGQRGRSGSGKGDPVGSAAPGTRLVVLTGLILDDSHFDPILLQDPPVPTAWLPLARMPVALPQVHIGFACQPSSFGHSPSP